MSRAATAPARKERELRQLEANAIKFTPGFKSLSPGRRRKYIERVWTMAQQRRT